jgi:membrane fusion protein (multidrug efflux system)
MKTYRLVSILLCTVVFPFYGFTECGKQQLSAGVAESEKRRPVKVTKPTRAVLSKKVAFLGFVEPKQMTTLHFLVPGKLQTCLPEGTTVKQGQTICELHRDIVKLEVMRAETAVKTAQRIRETNLPEKQKTLFDAGIIGQSEFEQVRMQTETAGAHFEDAQSILQLALQKEKEHTLRAPFSGVLAKISGKKGQPVAPEFPVALLQSSEIVQIKTELHASFAAKIKKGLRASLNAVSSNSQIIPVPLVVTGKASLINPTLQTLEVTLAFQEPPGKELFPPGIVVKGEIEVEVLEQALTISENALESWQSNGQATAFSVDEQGNLKIVAIRVGMASNGRVEIKEGLDENSIIVSEIGPDFFEGLPVRTISSHLDLTEKEKP